MQRNLTDAQALRLRQQGEEIFARFPAGRHAHGTPALWEAEEFAVGRVGELPFPELRVVDMQYARP